MDLEVTTDLAMLERLVAPAGKDVVDIGCGGGGLARALARLGARLTGVEVSEGQLAGARAKEAGRADASAGPRPNYRVGTAQSLPVDDDSVDLAVFMRTLHHVPPAELMEALREARRVVRPGGRVYVVEPLARGDYFALTALIEDEAEVRRAAAEALAGAEAAGLGNEASVFYDVRLVLPDVAAFRARNVAANPDRGPIFDARAEEIAGAFARLGEPGERPGERCFRQPMRADVLRHAGALRTGTRSGIVRAMAATTTELQDIETRADCERLVRAFYSKALVDPIIGWIFVDVAKLDLEGHVPQIASFWETILLGARTYAGGAFAPHAAIHMQTPLRRGHFERWLWLWCRTVDELFSGERAELAKSHAHRVATAFYSRLEQMSAAMELPATADVVRVTRHGPGK